MQHPYVVGKRKEEGRNFEKNGKMIEITVSNEIVFWRYDL